MTGVSRTQNTPTEPHGGRDQTQDTPTETHGRRDRAQNATRRETPPSPQQEHIAPPPAPARTHAPAGLYPAKRNISPAHYSRSHKPEYHIFASARTSALIGSRTKRNRPDRRPSARNNIILRRNRPSPRRIISPFPRPLPEFNLQWGGKTVIIKANKRNAERHKSQRFAHREPELLKAGGEARFFSTFQGGRR